MEYRISLEGLLPKFVVLMKTNFLYSSICALLTIKSVEETILVATKNPLVLSVECQKHWNTKTTTAQMKQNKNFIPCSCFFQVSGINL